MDRAKKVLVVKSVSRPTGQTNGAQAALMLLDELYRLKFDHYRESPQEIQNVTGE